MEIFIEIDKKKEQLTALGLSADAKRKLDKKFRLEWSYHSNHMEGNTLTYGETQMLLFFGKATGDHEKREFDEMEAHDVAVQMIEDWAKDEHRDITESDIRQLNKIILVRPFWKEAITPDGQPTRKEIVPGTYKTMPNSVRLKNGEIHEYSSPQETPILMKELMNTYDRSVKNVQHPIMTAVFFHHQFVAIHPFDDGNGRVARLLTNYILLRYNYPPVVIKTENKEEYLTVLQKADSGDYEPFMHFLIKELHWSLDISIKAAKGESIEEPGDLDKEIELLKMKLDRKDLFSKSKDKEAIERAINQAIFPLLKAFEQKCAKLQDLFVQFDRMINLAIRGGNVGLGSSDLPLDSVKGNLLQHLSTVDATTITLIDYSYSLKGFKKSLTHQYMAAYINVTFNEFNYTIRLNNDHQKQLIYSYDTILEENEINRVVKILIDYILSQIKSASGLAQ
jgi:Fic family protein